MKAQVALIGLALAGCPQLADDLEIASSPVDSLNDAAIAGAGGTTGTNGASGVAGGGRGGAAGRAGTTPIDAGAESGGSGGVVICGVAGLPSRVDCPPECSRCVLGVCHIDCAAKQQCLNAVLTCPPGLACEVHCTGEVACAGAIIACAGEMSCAVSCLNIDSCKEAQVVCDDGPCELACGPEEKACDKAILNCGSDRCAAKCVSTAIAPRQNCGSACECAACSP